ncbi:MAG: NAD(P)-dependent oxidoreductase [Parcubacteria group bacterium]|nr:NAD(P)-dependent oxidoreductase [Parcubacteria group bacterium]
MKDISVLGAAGGVGVALCQHLSREGAYHIRALVAPWDKKERVEELRQLGAEIVVGDIRNTPDLEKIMSGAYAVVNAAAILPDGGDKKLQYEVNVLANERILRLAKSSGVAKMVFISTAGVASNIGRGKEDESAPYRAPQNVHVWSKVENEKMLDRLSKEIGYYGIILRPASIYGPHMTFRWPEIIRYVQTEKMVVVNRGKCPYPLIHERDLARAIVLAIEKGVPSGKNEKIIVSSDEPLTIGDIANFIADSYGVRRPKSYPFLPVLLASYVLRLVPTQLKPSRFRLVTPQTVREYAHGHAYDTAKAKKLLGFQAEIKFADGMKEVLNGYPKPL